MLAVTNSETLSVTANVFQIVGTFIVAGIGIWRTVVKLRKWVHGIAQRVIDSVVDSTKPIQPNANGGSSLPDATKMLRAISEKQMEISERTARIEGALDTHLDWHNGG